jgi:hypothetical protein
MCSFSFPVVFGLFLFSLGSEQTKNPTGQKSLSVLESSAVIHKFGAECQYFFYCFSETKPMTLAPNDRTSSCEARGRVAIRALPGALLFALRTLFP